MRRAFIFLVVIAFLGGSLYWLIANNQGSVLISTHHYVVQFSLWTALVVMVVGILVLRLLYGALRSTLVPGLQIMAGRQRRRRDRWLKQNNQGLLALVEGRWDLAQKNLMKTADKLDTSSRVISYLAAANAATEKGDLDGGLEILRLAERSDVVNDLAIGLTRARIYLEQKRYPEALTQLHRLHTNNIHHVYILALLAQAYEATKEWDKLEKLLPDLQRHDVVDKQKMRDYLILVRTSQIQQLRQSYESNQEILNQLEQLWSRTTRPDRAVPEVLSQYVKTLVSIGESSAAESVLRKAISKNWQNQLVLQYGNLEGNNSVQQLLSAEKWLRDQPDNADLLLTLGRLCKRNQLWGKGRDYLEASLKLSSRPETCAELAMVMVNLGEEEQSQQFFKQGLLASLGLDHE